ncbi:hypothetical protein SAMN05428987_5217 [Paenibacillus sp. CF095]|uniref:hypothetical protein n=1 Tax=Paenibacillus sp. CF095 TaxID=1881033 RepID=UPI00088941EC|nr:hypothetical protein [Paenibacillus sp. CF095]SDD54404.1 hypothetical protein SAMN05428987_5217 [Paenibacillus sp. CF095]
MSDQIIEKQKFFTTKRIIILVLVIVIAAVFGRLMFRFALNLLLGGTMFGGNIL